MLHHVPSPFDRYPRRRFVVALRSLHRYCSPRFDCTRHCLFRLHPTTFTMLFKHIGPEKDSDMCVAYKEYVI